jgi:PAS domain S-box-containing protein
MESESGGVLSAEAVGRLDRLQAVTAALAQSLTPEDVARVVLEEAFPAVGASMGLLSLIDSSGQTLRLVLSLGMPEEATRALRIIPLTSEFPLAVAAKSGRPFLLEDTEVDASGSPRVLSIARAAGIRAIAVFPLYAEGLVIGSLAFDFPQPRSFIPADFDFLQALASVCGEALHRAELHAANLEARRRAEENAALLDALFSHASVGLTFLDRDLRYLRLNEALAAMNGLSVEAHLGRSVREVLPGVADVVEPLFQLVVESEQAILNIEVAGETPKAPGVERHWLENVYPVRDASGWVLGVGVVVIEITDLKRTQADLEKERALLRAVMEQMPSGLSVVDAATGNVVLFNRRAEEILGHAVLRGDEEASSGYGSIHADGRPYSLGELTSTRVLLSGEPITGFEHLYRRPDGRVITLSTNVAPVRDPDGKVLATAGVFTDVTGEREAEAAIREAHAELEELNAALEERVRQRTGELAATAARAEFLAALADALQSALTPTEVAEVAVGRLMPLLRARSAVVARARGDRLHVLHASGETPGVGVQALAEGLSLSQSEVTRGVLETGEASYSLDYPELPGGRPGTLVGQAQATVPFHFRDGRVVGILSVTREAREGEWLLGQRELLTRAAATIGLALERAEEREELARQKAELAALNAEADSFLHVVSHDLRQPLLSIQGMGDLLADAVNGASLDDVPYLVARVKANTNRMSSLLDDLLSLSRVGRAGDSVSGFDLGEVARQVVEELAGRVAGCGVRLELPPEWPGVRYPRSEAYQVLSNLLGNALKWAPRGRRERLGDGMPTVRVQAGEVDGMVLLTVEDSGPGVPPEYREKVFGLFQKLDAQVEGTGVGLSIVRRIAERHGGRAWVDDSSLGGAAFSVTFPKAEA